MKYDAVIIGFGKGGKTLAGALAKEGKHVALVERSRSMYGGTCINVGCIPSKSLVGSAAAARSLPQEQKAAHYTAAIAEKRRVTGMLRQKNYDKLNSLPNVDIIDGGAAFLSANQVSVTTEQGEKLLEAEQFFINIGSVPVIPPIEGLAGNPFAYTSETLMDHDVLPEHLIIIGGGYIGLEFASMYASFGSKVTVVQDGAQFIPREDDDIAAAILDILTQSGVTVVTGAQITKVGHDAAQAQLTYQKEGSSYTLSADAVLVATGRRPNTDALGCDKAGVALTPRGAIQVNDKLQTTAPNIYAMGDVTGGLQFTYTSLDDYRVVLAALHGTQSHAPARRSVPYSVFLSTPFSRAGMNEREAVAAGIPHKVKLLPAAAIPKAQVLCRTQGLLKAIVHAETDEILGVMLLCEESYEMINVVQLAMNAGLKASALRDGIYTHPTMTEALNDLFA